MVFVIALSQNILQVSADPYGTAVDMIQVAIAAHVRYFVRILKPQPRPNI